MPVCHDCGETMEPVKDDKYPPGCNPWRCPECGKGDDPVGM